MDEVSLSLSLSLTLRMVGDGFILLTILNTNVVDFDHVVKLLFDLSSIKLLFFFSFSRSLLFGKIVTMHNPKKGD